MSIVTMPTLPGIKKARFGVRALTMEFRGVPGNLGQTKRQTAWRWTARYELPPMTRAEAEPWIAFLSRMNGRTGRFYGYDPAHATAQGTLLGTPIISGANQTGNTLVTTGWTPGTAPILAIGDYIGWTTANGGREMHKVGTAATAGGTLLYNAGVYDSGGYGYGEASIDIVPEIRESPTNGTALLVTNVRCVMRLKGDEEAAWDVDETLVYDLAFEAEEIVADFKDHYCFTLPATVGSTARVVTNKPRLTATVTCVLTITGVKL